MSNAIKYDSLLVHYLAAELDASLRGRRVGGIHLAPDSRTLALALDERALVWELHPTRGWMLWSAAPPGEPSVLVPRRTTIVRVHAPADERLLTIEFSSAAQPEAARSIRIELFTNQWNAMVTDARDRVLALLRRRDAGSRILRPGTVYQPPPASDRLGRDAPMAREEWRALLAETVPSERGRVLVQRVAYMSPISAPFVAIDGDDLDAMYARYLAIASLPPAHPVVLLLDAERLVYPLPLPGAPLLECPTLAAAMAEVASEGAAAPAPQLAADPETLRRLTGRIEGLQERMRRLHAEQTAAAPKAADLRRRADLLLSQLRTARKGMERVELDDFEGGRLEIELNPALSPIENANALYDAARKRERAAAHLPAVIARLERERDRLSDLLARAERGEANAEELHRATAEPTRAKSGRAGEGDALPYRVYRSSGGREIRVGRSSRANDDLTFRHSAPNDIWLHARDVAGAHVVLRWGEPDANPPAAELAEAAVLAALHSRARTAGVVPVDWTRRKYVRKPRKAPPGRVVAERVKTIFVEPDPAAERRLRRPSD